MNLEARITRGRISYISSIKYDAVESRLIISFLEDPEEDRVDRILTFSGIEGFSEEEFEDEDVKAGINVIESLIGLDEYPENKIVQYVFHTELREMVFRTKEKPQIEDI